MSALGRGEPPATLLSCEPAKPLILFELVVLALHAELPLRTCLELVAGWRAPPYFPRAIRYPEVAGTNRQFRGIRKAQILLDGTEGVQFVTELRPEPHEMVVTKKRLSAAFDTELPVLLRSFLPEEVVRRKTNAPLQQRTRGRVAIAISF